MFEISFAKRIFWRILGWKYQCPLLNSMKLKNNGGGIYFRAMDFQRVMSRDTFHNIRSHMKFVPPTMSNDGKISALDQLRHSRKLLQHFQAYCMTLAMPTGISLKTQPKHSPNKGKNKGTFLY